jgi:hypothetical protein
MDVTYCMQYIIVSVQVSCPLALAYTITSCRAPEHSPRVFDMSPYIKSARGTSYCWRLNGVSDGMTMTALFTTRSKSVVSEFPRSGGNEV